jgi:hypothetical protein
MRRAQYKEGHTALIDAAAYPSFVKLLSQWSRYNITNVVDNSSNIVA